MNDSQNPNPPASPMGAGRAALYVFGLLGALGGAVWFTLTGVRLPLESVPLNSPNPTPLGYTRSLVLFLVPLAVLAIWFWRHPEQPFAKRAYWRTIALVTPLGFGLDLLLAQTLFRFPNEEAHLSLYVPGLGGGIPIEEFVFYAAGFMVVLLCYIWADDYWLERYNDPDYQPEAAQLERIVVFDPLSLVWGAGILAAGWLWFRFGAGKTEGFPLYLTFLVLAAFLPSAGLYRVAKRFINWRAFGFTLANILLVSVIWEVTLALPYGWWNYHPEWMVGITVDAWFGLPIEAVLVWVTVTYTTVIVYEVVKIWQASQRPLRRALFGL